MRVKSGLRGTTKLVRFCQSIFRQTFRLTNRERSEKSVENTLYYNNLKVNYQFLH
jgi:hypothetical protein